MIWRAPNFCPKNDLMHCVSLSKLRRFFLSKLRCFPEKKKKKVFTETETVFCQWCAQINRQFAQINRLFAQIFDVLRRFEPRSLPLLHSLEAEPQREIFPGVRRSIPGFPQISSGTKLAQNFMLSFYPKSR